MTDTLTASKNAVMSIPSGYSNAAIQPDEALKVQDLLELFLIHSANEIGYIFAENISGNVDKFADLMNQKAKELESQLKSIAEQIRILDDEYSEKLKIIDKKGVLKNLKISLKIYEAKKESISRTKFLFEQYEKHEKKKRILNLQKTQQIMEIETEIEQNEEMMDSFMETILQIHEFIMGNRECSFSIQTIDKAQSKTPVELVLRIYDDGSRSVDRTKVFIYDMALLFNQYTRDRHPLFLVHDNIFDVDQDTLVRCLNYIYSQEEQYQDFQYILTLNRDKIENEEQRKLIRMDIDEHQVAVFTKEKKFLGRNYQEK